MRFAVFTTMKLARALLTCSPENLTISRDRTFRTLPSPLELLPLLFPVSRPVKSLRSIRQAIVGFHRPIEVQPKCRHRSKDQNRRDSEA